MDPSDFAHSLEQPSDRFLGMRIRPRRIFAALLLVLSLILLCAVYAHFVEAHWLRITRVRVDGIAPLTIVHLSDIHFKGDAGYLRRVVAAVSAQEPDLVCLTGDLVEDPKYVDRALELLGRIGRPIYAVPGNWEY